MRFMGHGALACVVLLCLTPAITWAEDFVPREGDIVFHESTSAQSAVIKQVTRSRYTHMGVVVYAQGEPVVLEAISTVSMTPYKAWVERGKNHHVVVKRLKGAALEPAQLEAMRRVGASLKGLRYDVKFLWGDETMYCSELVWKIYERGASIKLTPTQRYSSFDLSDERARKLIAARFGKRPIPMDEEVVSPVSVYDSPLLTTVYQSP